MNLDMVSNVTKALFRIPERRVYDALKLIKEGSELIIETYVDGLMPKHFTTISDLPNIVILTHVDGDWRDGTFNSVKIFDTSLPPGEREILNRYGGSWASSFVNSIDARIGERGSSCVNREFRKGSSYQYEKTLEGK